MYKFFHTKNKCICVSSYAGKPIRGIAKCAPGDEFDYEIGDKLARLRCDVKVMSARYNRAAKKFAEAEEAYLRAKRHYEKMEQYMNDSEDNLTDAEATFSDFMSELGC